jgi:hypothetical protein
LREKQLKQSSFEVAEVVKLADTPSTGPLPPKMASLLKTNAQSAKSNFIGDEKQNVVAPLKRCRPLLEARSAASNEALSRAHCAL